MTRGAITAMIAVAGSLLIAGIANAQTPSDPEIVGIVQTADQIDISHAKLALKKSSNPQVKDFANQMISDLTKKLGVSPAESDTSKQLKQRAEQETKKLNTLKGKDFDREYASHEIAYHQAVLDVAGKTLIPNAKNAELKSALEGAAPLLQGHLQHAQQLQQSLGGR